MNIINSAPKEKPQDIEGWVAAINYFTGLGLMVFGVLHLLLSEQSLLNPLNWFFPFYFVLFGMMLLSSQFQFKIVTENMQFLAKPFGRGLFCIYTATLSLDLASMTTNGLQAVIGWAAFLSLCVIGTFHLIKGFKGKSTEEKETEEKQQELNASIGVIKGEV